jgi:hypothetical protein
MKRELRYNEARSRHQSSLIVAAPAKRVEIKDRFQLDPLGFALFVVHY